MVTQTRADGEPVEQLAWVDRNPESEESVDAMAGSPHEDKVPRIANNFEENDRKGEWGWGWVDINTR
jgi:hypothetical protein